MKKLNYTKMLKPVAMGVAGGVVANIATSYIEKQPFMANYQDYGTVPCAVAGIAIGAMFPKMEEVGKGMAIVSITELATKMIVKGGVKLGFIPDNTAMNGSMINSVGKSELSYANLG